MHPLFLLAIATFILLLGFLVWNLISTRRRHVTGGNTSGSAAPTTQCPDPPRTIQTKIPK